jgi:hypothetical protein
MEEKGKGMGKNRSLEQKRNKIKSHKMRRQGKLTMKQILKDRSTGAADEPHPKVTRYVNTGHNASIRGLQIFNRRVVDDPLDSFFSCLNTKSRYTDEELINRGKPDASGKITSNPVPLGEVKERLRRLGVENDETPQKWKYFYVRKEDHTHLALFFSPQKDRWFYVEVNPKNGDCKRSTILGSKEVAEFKRREKILTWVPLPNCLKALS